MINNRNISVVTDMKWTSDGKKICIVYEDGAVVVGSVDGNRIWGKELNMHLRFVEWSPDNRLIVFVTADSEVLIYDADGNRLRPMSLAAFDSVDGGMGDNTIVAVHWYCSEGSYNSRNGSGYLHYSHVETSPSLVIALESGMLLLSRGDEDVNSIVVNTEMKIVSCKWNHSGTVIAVSGSLRSKRSDESKTINLLKFYDAYGKLLRTMRVPGEKVSDVTWDGSGLRLALAVDSYIFFANARPKYTWAYLLNTVIYAYSRPDRRESAVIYWDLTAAETHIKMVNGLKFLAAAGDFCALVVAEKSSDVGVTADKSGEKSNSKSVYRVQLRNAIGAIIDSKTLLFEPKLFCMGPNHIVAMNDRTVYTWQFQSLVAKSGLASGSSAELADTNAGTNSNSGGGNSNSNSNRGGITSSSSSSGGGGGRTKERIFDIDNTDFATAQAPDTFKLQTDVITNYITCATIDDKFLVVGRRHGTITRYSLPHLSPESTYEVGSEPYRIEVNCSSSRLAVVDIVGNLSVLDLDARVPSPSEGREGEEKEKDNQVEKALSLGSGLGLGLGLGYGLGKRTSIERKDVWDLKWAEDEEEMLCIMEKSKLVVFRGEAAEEPVVASGYIARFKDLEIRTVSLDDLLTHPEQPNKECVIDYESKYLLEGREKIAAEGLSGGYLYADKNPHPQLWRLLAEAALEALDLNMAERAFVRCNDYYGIQLVKQLRSMPDKMKARAEVAVHLKRFDEAEAIYREIDRKDLAISMRRKIGDDMKVVQLLQTGGGNDKLVKEAYDRIGESFADRFKWEKAAQYFVRSRNIDRLAECYYRLENFKALADLCKEPGGLGLVVTDGSPYQLLTMLASRYETVGLYEEAVDCYIRGGNPKAAVDCCVAGNRWDMALELAEKHDYPQVEGLLTRFANRLISSPNPSRRLDAVELYRRANKPTEAAQLLGEIAEHAARTDVKPSLAKKLHVFKALEIERHRKRSTETVNGSTAAGGGTNNGTTIAQATAKTLETLMMTSLETTAGTMTQLGTKKSNKAFGSPWRGAAAYHFYMLAHKQIYGGNAEAGMKTAIKLCEYDDILDPRSIYSLLCLAALRVKFFGICSKAFVKLETISDLSDKVRDDIQTLAVRIFKQHPPTDPANLEGPYEDCLQLGTSYHACIITGRAIQKSEYDECRTCRHQMLQSMRPPGDAMKNCPLCHSTLGKGGSK